MPLLRYFLFVGGSLLALLLVANAALPAASAPEGLSSGADLPPIRILSERKLPERVVIDTSVAMPAQTPAAPVVVAQAQAPVAPATAEMSAEARVREAFAQLPQDEDAFAPRMSDMATVVVPEPRMYPARPPIKHKVAARPHVSRPMIVVAQQPTQPRGLFTW
ncbi:MAG TPA: hypothetical protein VKR55_00060 [Bradyrhizobium sp.]|uniref:hypothetical protein n=1 Tax=Bradyrhizobium sp. TaxID=376 RepID=UPI002B7302C4|nr:hypothetical protein [Bradyrhizobium sp.]HLZ00521.1 hypothetical protein [Bradyrhizobium sp.]